MQEFVRGKTILVVEDEAANRSLLAMVVESQEYSVITACHGAEVLDILGRIEPDAIVLDLMLPHVDGFAVIRTLQSQRRRIPIVTLTASGLRPPPGSSDVRAALDKPCRIETLLRVLGDVLTEGAHPHPERAVTSALGGAS